MTHDEIIAAFAKSRNAVEEKKEDFNQTMDRCLEEHNFPKNKAAPTRPSAPLMLVATVSTAAVGILFYLYKLFRRYMWPWIVRKWRHLQGDRRDGSEEENPEVAMKEIVSSQMYELHDTISTIKSVLDRQQSQIAELAKKDPTAVEDLRKEMESIKKLLLSKDSFPSAVPTQLPSWQIRRHDRAPNKAAIEEIKPHPGIDEAKTDESEESHVMVSHSDISKINDSNGELSHDTVSHEAQMESSDSNDSDDGDGGD